MSNPEFLEFIFLVFSASGLGHAIEGRAHPSGKVLPRITAVQTSVLKVKHHGTGTESR